MWLRFRNFENVRLRGRWAAPGRTLEHYLQECMTFYGEGSLPEDARRRIRAVAMEAVVAMAMVMMAWAAVATAAAMAM